MPEVKGPIEIGRPVGEVFAYLAEPKNELEWVRGVEVNELTSEGPMGVGAKGRRVETYLGRDEYVWEVTEWTPNELAALRFESDKFIADGELRTEPTDGGTRLTYRFVGSAKNPFFKLLMPLMVPMFKRQTKEGLSKVEGNSRVSIVALARTEICTLDSGVHGPPLPKRSSSLQNGLMSGSLASDCSKRVVWMASSWADNIYS